MKKFWKSYKYYYLFELNGNPEIIKADSMQGAIDRIFWRWFLGGSKSDVIFKTSNDSEALKGEYRLKHNRSFFNESVKATRI